MAAAPEKQLQEYHLPMRHKIPAIWQRPGDDEVNESRRWGEYSESPHKKPPLFSDVQTVLDFLFRKEMYISGFGMMPNTFFLENLYKSTCAWFVYPTIVVFSKFGPADDFLLERISESCPYLI